MLNMKNSGAAYFSGHRILVFLILVQHLIPNFGQNQQKTGQVLTICTSGAPCSCYNDVINCQNESLNTTYVKPLNDNIKYVNISFRGNRLTQLTKASLWNSHSEFVEIYDFSRNLISSIEDRCFDGHVALKTLILTHNKLTGVKSSWFIDLRMLQSLHLDSNPKIRKLEIDIFRPLARLQQLILANTSLSILPLGVFNGLSSLRRLDLDYNEIKNLDGYVFRDMMGQLEKLTIRFNYLEKLPKLPYMPKMKSLYLDGALVTVIKSRIFSGMPNLEEIYMDYLKNLELVESCAFCGLSRLKKFVLSDTFLEELPKSAFDPGFGFSTSLVSLDLSENNLSTLSADFVQWNKVGHILLESNQWICDCRISWMLDSNVNIGDNPECRHPKELAGIKIKTLTKEDMGGECRLITAYTTPKIFVSLTAIMIIASTILITWYLCASKTSSGIIDGLFPSQASGRPVPSVNRQQPYAYRNLAMQQEEVTNRVRQDDHQENNQLEVIVNPVFTAVERASML